jgi:hypothetical protein
LQKGKLHLAYSTSQYVHDSATPVLPPLSLGPPPEKNTVTGSTSFGDSPGTVAEIECEPTSDDDSLEPSARPVIQKTIRLYELSTHLLGMAATATLLSINWYNVYWIDSGATMLFEIPDQFLLLGKLFTIGAKLKYLQFAPKLHELVMLSSLSFILVSILHKSLLKGGIHLGFLDAPYMVGAGGGLSLLWAERFWAGMRGNARLGVIFIVSTVLTLVLEPCSAITTIPTLDWWPVAMPYDKQEVRVYINSSKELMWPTAPSNDAWRIRADQACLTEMVTKEPDCPGAGWSDNEESIMSFVYTGSPTNTTLVKPLTNSSRLLLSKPIDDHKHLDPKDGLSFSRRVWTTNSAINAAELGGVWRYVREHSISIAENVVTPAFESTPQSSTFPMSIKHRESNQP